MKRHQGSAILAAYCSVFLVASTAYASDDGATRRLSIEVYLDKVQGAWVGQMAGVGWGVPIEFAVSGRIVPESDLPAWRPETVNQFDSTSDDDLWVEMTFLRTLERRGLDVSAREAGIDLANSRYPAWVSDEAGRENLRRGIAPPDSGHPQFNKWADDICYQIQADFAGIIAPGMPQVPIDLGQTFGRLTAYGDGIYGGQFVGGMYAEAFFESDREKVVEAGLRCIPEGSLYHEIISDTLRWYREHPDDWEATWRQLEEKWNKDPARRPFDPDRNTPRNIQATLNGAYIVVGLLHGHGDPEATMKIALRCGQDNDCNPSNAAGVLFTMMGLSQVPDTYKAALDRRRKFFDSPYNFDDAVGVCESLARQLVGRAGGRIEREADGREVFVIPVAAPRPMPLERAWEPAPIANSRFTDEEMARIRPGPTIGQKTQAEREAELARQRRSPFDPRGEKHIPIGVPDALDTLKTFVEPDGSFSPGVGSYGISYALRDDETGALTAPSFDGIDPAHGLTPEGYLIPWSSWSAGGLAVRTEVAALKRVPPAGEVHLAAARGEVSNTSNRPRRVTLHVLLRPMGPAGFPVRRLEVTTEGDALLVEGRSAVVARTPPTAAGVLASDTIGEALAVGWQPAPRAAESLLGTCSGVLSFAFEIPPGEVRRVELICPVLLGRRAARHEWDRNEWFKIDQAEFNPPAGGVLQPDPGLGYFRTLDVGRLFFESREAWRSDLGPPRLRLPDPRWEQACAAIMGHLTMTLNEGAPDLVAVNLSVFNRDAAYMANALQKSGMFDFASVYLDHFLAHPFQGRVQPEADNPGQLLWVLGEHWKLTGDRAWLDRVYPAVPRVAALIRYARTTPGPHWVSDDSLAFGDALPPDARKELKPGACDGHNPAYTEAFDVAGLRSAAVLAEAAGRPSEANAFRSLADDLFTRYDAAYAADLGQGYGSYAVQWPCRLYPLGEGQAHDRFAGIGAKSTGEWRYFPLATAHQGLLSGNRDAGHGTIDRHLAEPQMQGWYAFDEGGPSGVGGWPRLRSTWSWNYPESAAERARPSGRAMPDGWALAETWLLMRDSLLFEDGDRLVLLGGVDPAWFSRPMAVDGLPTWFGACSFRYEPDNGGATLALNGSAAPPGGFALRLPEPSRAHVEADGAPITSTPSGDFVVPVGTHTIRIRLER